MRHVMRALASALVTRASGNAFVTTRSTASARARARASTTSSVGARREGASARAGRSTTARRGVVATASDEAREEALARMGVASVCPGCGVGLQSEDKNAPGFFVMPKKVLEAASARAEDEDEDEGGEEAFELDETFEFGEDDDDFDDEDIDETYVPPGFELADEENVSALSAERRRRHGWMR